ncbi:mediator of RNA polymerase II transcription subunit 13 isoform X2 [Hermetia illucens]|uniref:mediator of RNA polymerase II transcription subunit 13 isoform X2 n=1 Tax=Hermetia illucens TaxID=343691 RepID=UPI0018CC335D|nr:mediator of RNA polymerase II transcription subunit 13 isoform X2 [Hermetia illucens]
MTHQNHQTNGASLEDCHTNFFALTDLCGIKWRKFLFGERPNASGEPLDDPILQSYTQCLSKDILCVWRRVAAPKQDPDPNATIPFDIVSTHTHPPLALTAAKELWIFWYGDEPNFQDLVDPRLIESSDANAQGAWESGLSYECRSLLFKALHNLIERCLLSRDIVRLGKWFVQPCSSKDQLFGKSSHHLSFSFAFFVHGESTVCASMDLREHPAVRPLSPEYLAEAAAAAQGSGDVRLKPVILAPFGLAATLTGNSFKSSDPATDKLLRDWCCFYPLCNKENADLPQMVEIITGGVKMRYPSKYVLTTELDNVDCSPKEESKASPPPQQQILKPPSSENYLIQQQQQQRQQLPLPYIHSPPPAATLLPESVWQDCITNPATASANCNLGQSGSLVNNGGSISNSSNNNNIWNFFDPTQKTTCSCTKPSNLGTPQGGGASTYSRNPHSIGDSMAVPSVGSPSSAGPSPHPNSTLSQPTSVPPTDQLLAASPRPPTSVPTIQPLTPIDHLDKNTPAPTPTDQHDNKSVTASPYIQQNPSVEPPQSAEGISCPDSVGPVKKVEPTSVASSGNDHRPNNGMGTMANNTAAMNNFMALLKRPRLQINEYENCADEETTSHPLLYNFSKMEAWMNLLVKNLKPNDKTQELPHWNRKRRLKEMYEQQPHASSPMFSPSSLLFGGTSAAGNEAALKDHIADAFGSVKSEDTCMLQAHEIKKEVEEIKDKDGHDNLFTSAGLQVTCEIPDQIFDNSDDNSTDDALQVQTPPGSNKSSGCGMEELKKPLCTNNSSMGILRPEELSHMFPTPPSHEHHPNSSPCSGGMTDIPMNDMLETRVKQEIYVDFGSPPGEPIKDWSYVFIPPVTYTLASSSKYAPLTNLPSQSMPPITIPPNTIYKPTARQQPPPRQQQQDQPIQQMQMQQQHHQHLNIPPNNVGAMISSGNNPNNLGLGMIEREKQLPPMFSGNPLPRPPSASLLNYGGPQAMLQQQMATRTTISPISPATGQQMSAFPGGSPLSHSYRRTPVQPPPPPYELAVSSPDTSTSSYLNKQFNSQEPPTPSSTTTRAPEANSLLVNVLLYDTELNIFRDHNFDSCTLCVCNADAQKCVGNIRGADSGLYVSLPGTSFNPAVSNGVVPPGLHQQNAMSAGGNSSMRSLSAFGGIDSPSAVGSGAIGNQHQTGYVDEDPITCRCGFSAVVNRRLAHRSGLFYEDEMEITGMAEDPGFYKKKSILSVLLHTGCINSDENSNSNDSAIAQRVMDLLRDQCTIIQSSSSSIQRTITRYKRRTATSELIRKLNILEFADANDVTCLAIEQGRIAYESSMGLNNRMDVEAYRVQKNNISVHKWPYMMADGTRNNQDIIRMMNSMQPLLQNAFHSKNRKRWEATYVVKGPLTWRQFHMLAGRGVGQCEPQPIPSLIVGHEKDWLSVAPYAIQYWDKLMLEPFAYPRDVVYLVVSPEDDYVVSRVRGFFKELSTTYEMCKLGRHTPIKGWDGILQVGCRNNRDSSAGNEHSVSSDENSQNSGSESKFIEQLKLYVNAFQNMLVPYLSRIPGDRSLLDPPKDLNSNLSKDRPLPSPMPPPNTPDSQSQCSDKAPSTPKCDNETETQRDNLSTSTPANATVLDPLSGHDDDVNPPVIVIYVIDPFTIGSDSHDLQRASCLSLLKSYSELLATVPEAIRSNINFQIISLESVLELGRNRSRLRSSDEMKALSLSVFSQSRRYLAHSAKVKSLTGFGTAANMELFLKSKDEKNRAAYKMYTPPYILAPIHEKSDKTDTFRLKNIDQQYSVMYCNYCLSEDQSWLLASATDERGELMETITINIDIPNIRRRRHAPARRLGLRKLMDFILGIISRTMQPWRLVIGRIGRIGHGELKSWSWLLSKQNLQKVSKELKDICKQCSILSPHQVPSILSACLVTLEPDSNFRVMPDQFTPDERFSQISMQNPLSTPQDVTCTHILVFPTSAVSQSYQRAFNETHINGLENDDMIFDFGEEDEQIGDVNSMGDIFDWEEPMQQSPERNSNHGSPGCMEDNRSRQSPGTGGNAFNSLRNMHDAQDIEEVGTVLQQPLALGYLVSTAPTGPMPPWFWSSCPHMENVCPVFLKTALHLHVSAIQQSSDDPLIQNHSSATDHPLDSSFTADVLRYVLEGYNVLSWLAMDSNTHDRLSCLPINVQVLMQLYHMAASMA